MSCGSVRWAGNLHYNTTANKLSKIPRVPDDTEPQEEGEGWPIRSVVVVGTSRAVAAEQGEVGVGTLCTAGTAGVVSEWRGVNYGRMVSCRVRWNIGSISGIPRARRWSGCTSGESLADIAV